ncbi:MAG TPA: thermonuclease family protein [Solimonas sp.]|nr:thermonuclease family protein [Solimonas sp.]
MRHRKPRDAGLLAFWLLFVTSPTLAWQCERAEVLHVHDGDTLTVRCGDAAPVKLRVAGIDAPELHQVRGPAARDALIEHVHGEPISVVSRAVDRYGRTVADIGNGDGDIGLQLVAEGWAWCGLRPSAACRHALESARAGGRGLWADRDPQPPWRWRRAHPRTD